MAAATKDSKSKKDELQKLQTACAYIIDYLQATGTLSSHEASRISALKSTEKMVDKLLQITSSHSDAREELRELLSNEPAFSWFAEYLCIDSECAVTQRGGRASAEAASDDEVYRTISRLSNQFAVSPESRLSSQRPSTSRPALSAVEQPDSEISGVPDFPKPDSFAEGRAIRGVAAFNKEVYVVRRSMSVIEVYDVESFQLQRNLSVTGLKDPSDMTACPSHGFLFTVDCQEDDRSYSSNKLVKAIGKMRSSSSIFRTNPSTCLTTHWAVADAARHISMTPTFNVVVTCWNSQKLIEFTSDGKLIRAINLHKELTDPWHAVLLPSGEFVVSHGCGGKIAHSVCKINAVTDKCRPSAIYGNEIQEILNLPYHMSVAKQGQIYVADNNGHRIVVLDSTLGLLRRILHTSGREDGGSQMAGKMSLRDWKPCRLCLDETRNRLYVVFQRDSASKVVVYSTAAVADEQVSSTNL